VIRIAGNVALDAAVAPFRYSGHLDFAWKANLRNVALLERHLAAPIGQNVRTARSCAPNRWRVVMALGSLALGFC